MCTSVSQKMCYGFAFAIVLLLTCVGVLAGEACVVPDNGTGTITLPPMGCEYPSPEEVYQIIEGLPPGTTIELDGPLTDFICCGDECVNCSASLGPGVCETPGGTLGGNVHCFEATLDLDVTGTGELAGFNRHIAIPVSCEVHTGPRTPGDPVQTFPADMFRLQGELFGDPDFCTFRITGGTDYGLSGPGQTTLTELPSGDFAVDSFFDITYQIEFEGCPGSVLAEMAGTTTATIRIETGFVLPCEPTNDGSACKKPTCINPVGSECLPVCLRFDPATGLSLVEECDCIDPDSCRVSAWPVGGETCIVPDNGSGTITMPPMGCEYPSPEEVYQIIEGLPPGTTIELDGPLTDFICCGDECVNCSASLGPGVCETPGGTLGGNVHCFEATLDLDVTGTGELAGFNRHIAIPVSCEVHTGPRTPGDPVQTFPADMFRLQGELFGDPDFCTFRITGGTDYGLPGPGQTTLTKLPGGDFAVDSFFDVMYQIEFEGCPDSQLADYAGTTTATIRIQAGTGMNIPDCVGGPCPECQFCQKTITNNPDGTITVCCRCIPDADLNRDGIVDMKDFAIMAGQWLTTRP